RIFFEGRRAKQQRHELITKTRARPKPKVVPRIEPTIRKVEKSLRDERERQVPRVERVAAGEVPPLALLHEPPPPQGGYSPDDHEEMSRLVELMLDDFGIEVEVVAVQPGTVVTRFELQPAPGIKVSQITNLSK